MNDQKKVQSYHVSLFYKFFRIFYLLEVLKNLMEEAKNYEKIEIIHTNIKKFLFLRRKN